MWFKMDVFTGLLLLILSASSVLAGSEELILTKLIKENKTEQARDLSAVDPTLFLHRSSYSGFLTVDETYDSNTFFWFIEAESRTSDTPWIIWLQGGPGVSSLAGLFDEIGPFKTDSDRLNISARQWTWAKDHSLVFIDNPIGTGYSYTTDDRGYADSIEKCAQHLYNAVRQLVMVFPELRKAPLYIAGESYAGRYVPALGVKILEQDPSIGSLDVNFQGIIMGNPVINRDSVLDYAAVYYHWGLIDAQGLQVVKPLQDTYVKAIKSGDASAAIDDRNNLLDKLDELAKQQNDYNVLLDRLDHLGDFADFLSLSPVKDALHVGSRSFYFSGQIAGGKLASEFLFDARAKVEELLDHHYRVLIYCGQLDLTAPCVSNAEARRKYWQWNGRSQFLNAPRTPWWYNNSVAGYVKSGGGFTEVLVRGAGHLAPMDKPEEVTNLITYFIQGKDLPMPPGYTVQSGDTPEYSEETVPSQAPSSLTGKPGLSAGTIASIVINVLFAVVIVGGAYYALRWRRRSQWLLTMEETSLDSAII